MKNKLANIILFVFGISLNIFSQNFQKNLMTFDIVDANINGNDDSEFYKSKMAHVTFYQNIKDSVFNLAIVWPIDKSMSYGPIYTHPLKVNDELYEGHKTEKTYYQWFFMNSYDQEKGYADVEFSIVYSNNSPFYILRIITHNDFKILTFKGYINEKLTGLTTEIK